ncbi:DNA replication/checkpoint protein [Lipomyces orientalis]|uniref:DNA replication/checkpoint protein n=1 Tax=Lipomyces orientalis TaxID=1233043 RepID=A0ACC3TS70_9ASCO
MTTIDRVEPVASLEQLKLDIKNWEYEFKNRFGRQPEKKDVKQNSEIAAKYKEYQKAKQSTTGLKENIKEEEAHRRRDHHRDRQPRAGYRSRSQEVREASPSPTNDYCHTQKTVKDQPRHQLSQASTPTKSPSKAVYDFPYVENSVHRQKITVIGPTPQSDGRVLGIFDLTNSPNYLSQSQQTRILPSASPSPASMVPLSTPTKTATMTTPSSNRQRTPQSVTPSYFRPLNTNKIYMTPSPLKPKKVSRGLTSILAELRQMQDEELDEHESIMLEIENCMPPIENICTNSVDGVESAVGLEHSAYHLGEIKEGDAEMLLRESKQKEAMMLKKAKYTKAKTQKRTTRRVILRPAKPTVGFAYKDGKEQMEEEQSCAEEDDDEDEDSGGKEHTVAKLAAGQDGDNANKKRRSSRKPGSVSQNFKRLKLRNASGSRFSRRRK